MKRKVVLLIPLFLVVGVVAGTLSDRLQTTPATLAEGQTVQADPSTMIDTAKAVTLIDQSKAALCQATITGVAYFSNPVVYVGQNWYKGLSALTLAQSIATNKGAFDMAGNALKQTTITGKKYCASPTKWPSGLWAAAFSTLASARAYLVANPLKDGPSIKVLP